MFRFLKKIITVASVLIALLFLAFVIAAWHYGAFASVKTITLEQRPALYAAILPGIYSPYEIEYQIRVIDSLLLQKNIDNKGTLALFFDSPLEVTADSIRATAAILLAGAITLDSPLTVFKIPERRIASISIQAHPAIAPFKTYPALQRWLFNNGYRYNPEVPIIEYYFHQNTVEVEMPVIADSLQDQLPLKEQ
jgi:hypothetical protein